MNALLRTTLAFVVAASSAASILLCSAPARAADPPAPGLNWIRATGAESCMSAAALAQSVESRVGRVLFGPASAAGLFVDGYVRAVAPNQ